MLFFFKEFDKKGNSDLHPLYLYLTIQIESSNTNNGIRIYIFNSMLIYCFCLLAGA